MHNLVSSSSDKLGCTCLLKWLHEQFLFSGCFHHVNHVPMNVLNPKVVVNFHILLVLEFHDFKPASLGVIVLASSMSVSVLLSELI
jgi:hypothetical protein